MWLGGEPAPVADLVVRGLQARVALAGRELGSGGAGGQGSWGAGERGSRGAGGKGAREQGSTGAGEQGGGGE